MPDPFSKILFKELPKYFSRKKPTPRDLLKHTPLLETTRKFAGDHQKITFEVSDILDFISKVSYRESSFDTLSAYLTVFSDSVSHLQSCFKQRALNGCFKYVTFSLKNEFPFYQDNPRDLENVVSLLQTPLVLDLFVSYNSFLLPQLFYGTLI